MDLEVTLAVVFLEESSESLLMVQCGLQLLCAEGGGGVGVYFMSI